MNKIILFIPILIIFIAPVALSAQATVGVLEADPSAALHVESTNKGVLIPRINLANITDQASITGPIANSLLIYNTNGTLGTGFYYWEDTATTWRKLADSGNIGSLGVDATSDASITLGNATGATLKALDIKVATDGIQTVHITDANVTPVKIEPSVSNSQVLTTVGGVTVWATPAAENVTTITNTISTGEHKIADYTNENAVVVPINETVTAIIQDDATGVISFADENGVTDDTVNSGAKLDVVSVEPTNGNAVKVGADGGAYINPLVTEVFSAEYAGATLFADGSDNTGMMTSDNTGAGNDWMNYYEWASGEATAQDYDVIVRFTLPKNFTAWDATDPIVIDYQAEGATTFGATMFLEDGTALGTIAAASSATWATANINPGAMTAGETAVIVLKLTSAPGDDTQKVRIGDITLNYIK